MLVNEVMTKKVITIDKEKTVSEACEIYKEFKIGCIIVTEKEKIIGMLTERDIIERTICAGLNPEFTKVSEIMSKNIFVVHKLDTIEKAISLMIEKNIKKLPVVSKENIVGIITVTDISKARPDLSKRFMNSWVKPTWRD